jgi:DNA segregation ATPase FtsK/SpoIIIE, S-DNA-T family
LRLILEPPDGRSRDVLLTVDPDVPARDVLRELVAYLRLPPSADKRSALAAYCLRTGALVNSSVKTHTLGLRHGDKLVIRPETDLDALVVGHPVLATLEVSGPNGRMTVELRQGKVKVGRDPSRCRVSIDDDAISGEHIELDVTAMQTTVTDLGSRNGTSLSGEVLPPRSPRAWSDDAVLHIGQTDLRLERAPEVARSTLREATGVVRFNRPPRRTLAAPGRVFRVEAPPEDPPRNRIPFITSVIPLLVTVPLYFINQNPWSLAVAVLTPVITVFQYLDERRSGRRDFGKRSLEFRTRVAQVQQAAAEEGQREETFRRISAPDVGEVLRIARSHTSGLWSRRPGDPDFAQLRVGLGDQPAATVIETPPGGSAALRTEADQKLKVEPLHDVPVVVPIARLGSVGICGPRSRVDALARWLVAQAAVFQSHSDLLITAAVPAGVLDDWSWMKWLPHTYVTPSSSGLTQLEGGRSPESLMRALVELTRSRARHAVDGAADVGGPFVLAVVDGDLAVDRAQAREILTKAARARVGVIWLARDKSDVPGDCAGIIELDARSQMLTWTETTGTSMDRVRADEASLGQATDIALALAPVRDPSATVAGAEIPRRLTLLELLEVGQLTPEWVAARWREGHSHRAAAVGAAAGSEYVIDLNRDGPHGLVAGTTGSGKSELLRAWIASLALTHSPHRLTFLLIDYKGGAAFGECHALPHTVGYVTDLEGNLAARALTSLRAEMVRRQLIFREAGVTNLVEMVRAHPETAPASLMIVVDEFARLVHDTPEFVDGLVDVAQAGRSLGLHMVLATQRPAGIVTASMRANTNLRIALRVIDQAESEDIIGAPDAARIGEDLKGRAYARTGQSALVEFQAAYVSGRSSDASAAVTVSALAIGPIAPPISGESATDSDLQRIVTATRQAMEQMRLKTPPKPWLPPLETCLPLATLTLLDSVDRAAVAIVGLRDEPKEQRQVVHTLPLREGGNLLVYGGSGSGKTNALRTIAVSLASLAGPEDLHIYGIDFGSGGLRPLRALPQCGSIIAGDDVERVGRLFAVLKDSIDDRRARLAAAGAFTIDDYAARGNHDMPRILVLLDDFDSFESAYNKVQHGALVETLQRLVSEGRPFGVHFAISAERRGSTPSALLAAVPRRIVLRLASEEEYSNFGLKLKDFGGAKDLPAGRGVTENGLEVQVAIVGADPSPTAQATAIEGLGQELKGRYGEAHAPAVEILASSVALRSLPVGEDSMRPVIGIRDSDLGPFGVDLNGQHLAVFGAYRTGRSTTLRTLVSSIRRGMSSGEIHLLAPRRSPLLADDLWSSISASVETCDEKIREIAGLVQARADDAGTKQPIMLVIDDAEELLETEAASDLHMLVKLGAQAGIVVAAALESRSASRGFSPWLNELRKQEQGILLNADPDSDGDLLHVVLPRLARTRVPGRGYYVYRGSAELVQVATIP